MFTVRRTGDAASELTVSVTVKETGTTLAGATPAAVTFGAGKSSTALVVGTDDDEAASTVNASVLAGEGYAGAAHILDRKGQRHGGFCRPRRIAGKHGYHQRAVERLAALDALDE